MKELLIHFFKLFAPEKEQWSWWDLTIGIVFLILILVFIFIGQQLAY